MLRYATLCNSNGHFFSLWNSLEGWFPFSSLSTHTQIHRAGIKKILSTDWFLSMGYQSETVEYIWIWIQKISLHIKEGKKKKRMKKGKYQIENKNSTEQEKTFSMNRLIGNLLENLNSLQAIPDICSIRLEMYWLINSIPCYYFNQYKYSLESWIKLRITDILLHRLIEATIKVLNQLIENLLKVSNRFDSLSTVSMWINFIWLSSYF